MMNDSVFFTNDKKERSLVIGGCVGAWVHDCMEERMHGGWDIGILGAEDWGLRYCGNCRFA